MVKIILKTPICSHCETGRKDYELDRISLSGSQIICLKNGKCDKYESVMRTACSNSRNPEMI